MEVVATLPLIEKIKNEFGGVKVVENGFEYWVYDDPQRVLEALILGGEMGDLVFHGSTVEVRGNLEPRVARDLTRHQGRQNAIYATNNPVKAMFWSLTGGTGEHGRKQFGCKMKIDERGISYENVDAKVERESMVRQYGYVYVIDGEGWKYSEGEYMSDSPVVPLMVLKIDRGQFKFPIEVGPVARDIVK